MHIHTYTQRMYIKKSVRKYFHMHMCTYIYVYMQYML